jgi:hypothetical protein
MSDRDNDFLEELTWKQAREEVKQIAPELADIIDRISPNDNYKLIKATYAYGHLIVNDGILCLPDSQGKVLPINTLSKSSPIAAKLAYSPIPLFLTLEKANEVFVDTGTRIIPLNLFKPGSLLGLFESADYLFNFESKPNWSVSAGVRSIIMLAKITESSGLRRLRSEFKLPASLRLNNLADHAHVFNAIARHPNFKQAWQSKVLFFTQEWFDNHHNDPDWLALHRHFFKHTWQQAKFAISRIELSLGWETFVDAISSRKLKPTPYIADQVKHVLSIAAGRSPGFRPSNSSQLVAPTQGLQETFIDIYQLKHYFPTIMHPYTVGTEDNQPAYYSLLFSTVLEGTPHNESSSTIMLDLREIKLLLDTAFERTLASQSKFSMTIKNTSFEYFHVEADKFEEIQSSKLIPEKDLTFHEITSGFQDRIFCSTSAFWRGCIRIWPTA